MEYKLDKTSKTLENKLDGISKAMKYKLNGMLKTLKYKLNGVSKTLKYRLWDVENFFRGHERSIFVGYEKILYRKSEYDYRTIFHRVRISKRKSEKRDIPNFGN